jgi:glutamine cyclotransferase
MKIITPILLLLLAACSSEKKTETNATTNLIGYTLVKAFPHDITAFTQGLTVHDGNLYESTGQANSWIALVDIASGNQDKKVTLGKEYFGEGITILNNKVYQLTWQNKVGFVYALKDFTKLSEFTYPHEGWGITSDNHHLIVSDGTDKLHFLDTLSLKEVKAVNVKESGNPMKALNELEFIDGFIYANQWQTPYILKIDPSTGEVVGRMDLTQLLDRILTMNPNADVLNGIGWEKKSKTLLVTGKYWPVLFALRFKEATANP